MSITLSRLLQSDIHKRHCCVTLSLEQPAQKYSRVQVSQVKLFHKRDIIEKSYPKQKEVSDDPYTGGKRQHYKMTRKQKQKGKTESGRKTTWRRKHGVTDNFHAVEKKQENKMITISIQHLGSDTESNILSPKFSKKCLENVCTKAKILNYMKSKRIMQTY